jgi:hypothetical protein
MERDVTDPDDPAQTLLTTTESATAAHVTTTVIRQWDTRGHITPAGRDPAGHPLYRESAILAAEKRTRRQRRERELADTALAQLDHTDPLSHHSQ